MTYPLIALLIVTVTWLTDVLSDLHQWGKINHIRGAVLRSLPVIVAGILDWKVLLLLPLYGVLFDLALNFGRGLPLLRIGESSALDRLQLRHRWLVWVKWGMGIGGLVAYIMI